MTDPSSILGPLLNYGVVGLFLVGMLLGQVIPGWLYRQMRAERDQARAETAELRIRMDEKVVPMMQETGQVLREAIRALDARARR